MGTNFKNNLLVFSENNFVVLGEVGLGGEIRSIGHIEKRILEAEKLGFENVVIPQNNIKSLKSKNNINLISVDNITEAIDKYFLSLF